MSKALSTQQLPRLHMTGQANAGLSEKQRALTDAAHLLGTDSAATQQALSRLWDTAFEQGQLAALDELQDRFCVCMK